MPLEKLTSGQSVMFKLKDAVCPEFGEAVAAIGSDLQVTGNVVFTSDGCGRKAHFAVVEVGGIHIPLIVPVDRLRLQDSWVPGLPEGSFGNGPRRACSDGELVN